MDHYRFKFLVIHGDLCNTAIAQAYSLIDDTFYISVRETKAYLVH